MDEDRGGHSWLKIVLRASFEPHHGRVHSPGSTSFGSQPAGGRQFMSHPTSTPTLRTTVASAISLNQAVRARSRPVAESSGCRLAGRRIRQIGALVASDHCRRRAQLDAPSTRRSVTLSVAALAESNGTGLAFRVRHAGDRGFSLPARSESSSGWLHGHLTLRRVRRVGMRKFRPCRRRSWRRVGLGRDARRRAADDRPGLPQNAVEKRQLDELVPTGESLDP